MELDFGDVKSGAPPEGMYRLRVADVQIKPTKDKPENKNLSIEFDIVEPDEWIGWKVWDSCSLTPQARWRLQQVLEGITGEDWREDSMQLDPRDLLGKEVEVSLFHKLYEGKTYANIKDYFGPDVTAGISDDPNQLTFGDEEEPF